MRIVMDQYADGDQFAEETANDGSVVVRKLLGQRKYSARLDAYAVLVCSDTPQALEQLENSLEWLREEVRRRQNQLASV